MLVSDYILKFLLSKGVKKVFLLTGGAIAFTVDAFARNKNISYVSVAHEQAAAMMADSYSRLGPNFAATMVTSGPGATNAITGLATAFMDSIPLVVISGQVQSHLIGTDSFQETDMIGVSRPIVKHSYLVQSAEEIPSIVQEAFYIAQTGRPGPVVIDIPKDKTDPLHKYKYKKPAKPYLRSYQPKIKPHPRSN